MNPLRCTVIDARRPATPVDVDVHAAPGTLLGDVAARVLALCDVPASHQLAVRGRPLPPTQPLGLPPLVDGALLVALPADAGQSCDAEPTPRIAGVLWLCVVSGPDAGRRLPLRPGTQTVGRGGDATFTVADPAMSRRHLSVVVGPDGAVLHDLGSTNGTRLEAQRVPASGMSLQVGQRVRAGDSTLVVQVDDRPHAATRPDGRGGIELSRAPRELPVVQPVQIVRPAAPGQEPAARFPWVAVLVPLALCLPIALLMHQPSYLAFGLIGPMAMAATTAADRRGRRRRDRAASTRWRETDDAAAEATSVALAAELAQRRRRTGDAAEIAATAAGSSRRLWERSERDDDLLEVHLGSARTRSAVQVVQTAGLAGSPGDGEWLSGAPFTLRLDEVGHLGLSGDSSRVGACARYLLGQLATRCTPRAVRLVSLTDEPAWSWTTWLPHQARLRPDELEDEVARRRESARAAGGIAMTSPRLVVLLDLRGDPTTDPDDVRGAPPVWEKALASTLRHGPEVGVHLVCLARRQTELPSTCQASVQVPPQGPAQVRQRVGSPISDLRLDGVGPAWAQELARALAPLRDATPEADGAGSLPASIGLCDLLDVPATSGSALAEHWTARPRSTRVVLGAGADGPATVDLVVDGPHTLVAGTTGAGKSELLLTMVTSLAVANRPDELCFVLVDYKGGAAFQRCARLPHVVGLVTDLDAHLAARALTSLQAELTRRERLLADVGAADLAEYQRWSDAQPGRSRLARLVLVIDEFRLLAKELPDFLDGLVRLAAVGRSLGVHLVLATQRPAGIVSADIRANVNVRICLRVRDRVDSEDVLDAPDAAALPDEHPGRALLRSGSGALVAFQTALAGGAPTVRDRVSSLVLPAGQLVPAADPPDDLADLVGAVGRASERVSARPPASPWLPPLPAVLPLELLTGTASEPASGRSAQPGVVLGLADRPDHGSQEVVRWDPGRDSHLAVSGAPRSGRTSALLTVVRGLLSSSGAAHHVHVVDFAGGALAATLGPAVQTGRRGLGTVLSADQPLAVRRLLSVLSERLHDGGTSAGRPGTVLVVDGWEALAEALEQIDHGRGLDELLSLVRDGEQAGLRLVVAGGRGVLLSRLASLVGERLLLRPTDPSDLLLAGAPSIAAPRQQPPGRAIQLPSGDDVQLAWPGEPEQLRQLLARAPADESGADLEPPVRLRPLPVRVELPQLDPRAATQGVVLGVGGDEALPITLDLDVHRRLMVCGPGGSGRSQTLATIAEQLHRAGRSVTAVAAGDSPLLDGRWPTLRLGETTEPALPPISALFETDCLLVDDVEDLPHHPRLSAAIDQLAASHSGPALVWVARRDTVRGPSAALTASAHRHRSGILLQPRHARDGEPLGVLAEPAPGQVPGRGLLVLRGRCSPLQVACGAPG